MACLRMSVHNMSLVRLQLRILRSSAELPVVNLVCDKTNDTSVEVHEDDRDITASVLGGSSRVLRESKTETRQYEAVIGHHDQAALAFGPMISAQRTTAWHMPGKCRVASLHFRCIGTLLMLHT